MTKKYMFKIDYSEVTEKNVETVSNIVRNRMDGEICTKDSESFNYIFKDSNSWDLSGLPKSWLTEITEPLEFDEWFEQQDLPLLESTKTQHERTWKAGIENDHLKIMQTLDSTKKAYLDNHCGDDDAKRIQSEFIWNLIVETLFLESEDDNT